MQPEAYEASRDQPGVASLSLESASKLLATFALALYGGGLIIMSVSYSQYGFSDVNPLKARTVIAGAWFMLLCATSYALLQGTKHLLGNITKTKSECPCYGCAEYRQAFCLEQVQ